MGTELNFEHESGFARTITTTDIEAILAKSQDYVVAYGIKQSLADSFAGAKNYAEKNKLSVEDAVGVLFDKRLRKLLEGTMDIREVTRSTDPVKTETRRLANETIDGWVRAKTLAKPTKDARKALVAHLMKDEHRIATATANVERAAEAAKAELPADVAALLGLVEPATEPEAPKAKKRK
jgi:hypothetical protein